MKYESWQAHHKTGAQTAEDTVFLTNHLKSSSDHQVPLAVCNRPNAERHSPSSHAPVHVPVLGRQPATETMWLSHSKPSRGRVWVQVLLSAALHF